MNTKSPGREWTDWRYRARIVDDAFMLELEMRPTRGPMFVGGDGNTGIKEDEDMFYYSFTRLESKGTLETGGEERAVRGTLWYDHQFGTFGSEFRPIGWDWFCIQLENGADLNLSVLRYPDTGRRFNRLGTIQRADGRVSVIRDLVVEHTALWTSPDTGITWPSGWVIAIPSLGMHFTVTPEFPEQEMRTFGPNRALWEGACNVTAVVDGESVNGLAYTELVGYGFPAD